MRWFQRRGGLADGRHPRALLAGIPFLTGFGLVLAWGEMYQRMHALDATCSESWGRPECRFALSSWTLLPWIAGSMLLAALATLEIAQASRKLHTPSVAWVGLPAGLSMIGSLICVGLVGLTWTSTIWAYGSFAILVAAATRSSPREEARRLAPDILLAGLPVLLFVGVIAVLQIMA